MDNQKMNKEFDDLQAHLKICLDCQPSVMTADKACKIGKWLLKVYTLQMRREYQEWWDNHPEEWTYTNE